MRKLMDIAIDLEGEMPFEFPDHQLSIHFAIMVGKEFAASILAEVNKRPLLLPEDIKEIIKELTE